ncbi:spore coat protein U domain-containing protein [Bradyrhizobium sp. CB1650]|uniref:Csu type fimbrial protein n=1 Tax=Bradyrhizobium sp. CB1650 TaxID=3039153 RepID=UPI002435F5C8|nr:spore coat protein U domain-containing protein [Bradyrhizobium sp. CB1650]WGD49260.1 spore coat protein U domain-containing protein [Bradyrhizobium sp. CB1650]
MPVMRMRFSIGTALALALLLAPTCTHAQSCSFSVSAINFGSVDTLSGSNDDTTAAVDITCSGIASRTIRLCPNLGSGTSGTTETNRRILSGTNPLSYQLYSSTWGGTIWGSNLFSDPPTPPALSLTLNALGSGSLSSTIFARVFGGQSTAPAGSYTSSYSGTQAQLRYQYCSGTCPACSASLTGSTNATFSVTGSVASNCLVAAQNINFGATGVLTSNIDATGQVTVTCTPNTSYTVSLNGGTTNAPPAARKMSKSTETVTYGLYKDAARSQVWGDAGTPGSTVPGTGTGLAQNLSVYGRVPPQATPSPGVYSDTVVVTVTY